jgi:hypothetical protein
LIFGLFLVVVCVPMRHEQIWAAWAVVIANLRDTARYDPALMAFSPLTVVPYCR